MQRSMMLDLRVGESVSIDGGRVVVKLMEKSGQRARLNIMADKSVSIDHEDTLASQHARRGLTKMQATAV